MSNKSFNLKARMQSFRHAFRGVRVMIRTQHNSRIHLLACTVVIILGLYLNLDRVEWVFLALAAGLVFVAELANTAIEFLCDEVSEETNGNIRNAKDLAAGAVLIASLCAAIVGGLVFISKLIPYRLWFTLSLIILWGSTLQAQKEEGYIVWDANRPLEWGDFKGNPVRTSPFHAQTQGSINYSFDDNGQGGYTLVLQVKFDKRQSWSKPEEETDVLLQHEQGHFDIYEIYGRMMIQRIVESHVLNQANFSGKVEKIFSNTFSELQKFQQAYDRETDHSKDREKQEIWNKKLTEMLTGLDDFKVKEIPLEQ